jgi:ATP-binding cassette subfamily C protein
MREALSRCRGALLGVGLFSAVINVLALTGSLYMLQLYDRVIPSHSVPTLVGLSILMLLLYAGFGLFDLLRARLLSRIGVRVERALRDRVLGAVLLSPLRTRQDGDGLQPVRDLDQVRGFLSGQGPIALFDLPWMPFYLGLVFLLHPWLGVLGATGAILLLGLTVLTEMRGRSPMRSSSASLAARQAFGEASRRNAEAVHALGMGGRVQSLWGRLNEIHLSHQLDAGDVTATYGTLSRVLRTVLQSAVLGLGAYLVISGEATAGVMIAASILVARALAPIEIAIANWRGFIAARHSLARLSRLLAALPARKPVMQLPPPARSLDVEGLFAAAPGQQRPILHAVSFSLEAGAGLGVIGPSASGKSTLARALVGAWLPLRGTVRLDRAALDQWGAEALGRHIGYLPQGIELFDGTVAENIARFDPHASSESIIAAARAAGVHDMIVSLPEGYETVIGEGGDILSAGQRQRVALARALYGDPFLVVLDEPNSNLDAEGEAALAQAIKSVRARGGIAIVIAHRPSALGALDEVLVLSGGQVRAFGPKDEVLNRHARYPAPEPSQPSRLKLVSETVQAAS